MRVLKEGVVEPGRRLQLLERESTGVTCAFAIEVFYQRKMTKEKMMRLLAIDGLAEQWRGILLRRLDGENVNTDWEKTPAPSKTDE